MFFLNYIEHVLVHMGDKSENVMTCKLGWYVHWSVMNNLLLHVLLLIVIDINKKFASKKLTHDFIVFNLTLHVTYSAKMGPVEITILASLNILKELGKYWKNMLQVYGRIKTVKVNFPNLYPYSNVKSHICIAQASCWMFATAATLFTVNSNFGNYTLRERLSLNVMLLTGQYLKYVICSLIINDNIMRLRGTAHGVWPHNV